MQLSIDELNIHSGVPRFLNLIVQCKSIQIRMKGYINITKSYNQVLSSLQQDVEGPSGTFSVFGDFVTF